MHGRILITGGSGYLARGILSIARHQKWNAEFTILSRDEYKQELIKQRFPQVRCVLGDVTDPSRLRSAFQHQDLIIHTAAVKFIPEAEFNVDEAIRVNVGGSRNVLEAACSVGANVVCISTDKASAPLNVYGMTKALMERLCGEYARLCSSLRFTCVRYGNVVGSTGSVIPLFERQLAELGHITITDPHMTRFWISIDQAVDLIGVATEVESGNTVIPKASSMDLMSLAMVITNGDTEKIKVLGIRPGEKRHELLINNEESTRALNCGSFYQLIPAYHKAVSEPFIITSNTPDHLLTENEMRDMITRSKCV